MLFHAWVSPKQTKTEALMLFKLLHRSDDSETHKTKLKVFVQNSVSKFKLALRLPLPYLQSSTICLVYFCICTDSRIKSI